MAAVWPLRAPRQGRPRGPSILVELAAIAALVVAQGILAGTEVAVGALREGQLRALSERDGATGRAIAALRHDPAPLAAAVQLGVIALSSAAGALGAACLAPPLTRLVQQGMPGLGAAAEPAALALLVGLVAGACVVLGHLLPVSLALRASHGTLALFGRPLLRLARLARPLMGALGPRRPGAGGDEGEAPVAHSAATLQQLVDEAQRGGTVHPRAAEIAVRALTFGDLTVADVMVPRNQVHAVPADAGAGDLRRILLEEGHSCMPVYDGTLDQVVGVLVAKDVLALAWERELIVLEDLLHTPYFAPEIMRAADLLKELQRRRMHFAIAVDELGGTAGIVTIEDLLEELVGEIFGEHDADSPETIRRQDDGSALVQGSAPLRDVNRELHLDLPEGDTWSTVGGLCVSLAGRIPEVGNKLLAGDGTRLEVLDASQRRVRLVRLRGRAEGRPAAAASSAPRPAP